MADETIRNVPVVILLTAYVTALRDGVDRRIVCPGPSILTDCSDSSLAGAAKMSAGRALHQARLECALRVTPHCPGADSAVTAIAYNTALISPSFG